MQSSKHNGCGDDQIALGRAVFAGRRTLRISDLFENTLARRDISFPGVGERQLARRADEEPRVEVRFKIRDLAAYGRQRRAELTARRREAAGFGRGNQDRHGFEAVHHKFHKIKEYVSKMAHYSHCWNS